MVVFALIVGPVGGRQTLSRGGQLVEAANPLATY